MVEMTPRWQEVLAFFREREEAGLPAPSMREVGAALGHASTSPTHYMLRAMVRRGLLVEAGGPGAHRSYALPERVGAPGRLRRAWEEATLEERVAFLRWASGEEAPAPAPEPEPEGEPWECPACGSTQTGEECAACAARDLIVPRDPFARGEED